MDVRKFVRKIVRDGFDLIKTSLSGGIAGELEEIWWRNYSDEELLACVDEAHAFRKKVAIHAYTAEAIKRGLKAGVDTVEHGFPLDREAIDLFLKNKRILVPTLQVFLDKPTGYKSAVPPHAFKKTMAVATECRESFTKACSAGVKIAFGTDLQINPPPARQHGNNAFELELMVKYGMTESDAIVAATKNGSEALGQENIIGTLEIGKLADFILVDGNPLENIKVLQDKRRISVFKGGNRVAPQLDRQTQ